MNVPLQPLAVILPPLYLLSCVLHGMAFGGPESPRVDPHRRWVFRLTIAVHLLAGWVRARDVGGFPVDDTWTVLSAVTLAAALIYGWIAMHLRHPGSGGVVLALLFILQLFASSFMDMRPGPVEKAIGPEKLLHVGTSVLAAASLILSGVHGALYLLLFRQMRKHTFGALFAQLPDLDLLARMTRRSALAGFLFLSIGVNVGIFLAHRNQVANFEYSDPQVIATLFLWVYFGVIAFSGSIRLISARRASFAAVAGLVLLIASLLLPLFTSLTFHAEL